MSKKNRPLFQEEVYIAAEISANHGGRLSKAIALIKKAKICGASAVKFQIYHADSLTINMNNKYFRIRHPKWGGQTLYELYQKAQTPFSWFKELKHVADQEGIGFFATAFDRAGVDVLEEIGVRFHKTASFELVDLALIEYMAQTRKPIILSTGMAAMDEIRDAVTTARRNKAAEVILLKCVSSYPARPQEMNLKTMADMRHRFSSTVGLSDHTLGTEVAVAAVALGARFVEKHFILSRNEKTPDSFFSIEPDELTTLVEDIRLVEKALGRVHYGLTSDERASIHFRRSLFVVKPIARGEKFTLDNVRSIRPFHGLAPKFLTHILGRPALRHLAAGTPLKLEMVG